MSDPESNDGAFRFPIRGGSIPPLSVSPGSSTEITMELNHMPTPLSFHLDIPSEYSDDDVIGWGTARVEREGGSDAQDLRFRRGLYFQIGRIAVAGGKIEAAMKRLTRLLDGGEKNFAGMKTTWTDVESNLRKLAHDRPDVIAVLDWGVAHRAKTIRDDVIHAEWWDFEGAQSTRNRMLKSDATPIIDRIETLAEHAEMLTEFAVKLDDLVRGHWHTARFPRTGAAR